MPAVSFCEAFNLYHLILFVQLFFGQFLWFRFRGSISVPRRTRTPMLSPCAGASFNKNQLWYQVGGVPANSGSQLRITRYPTVFRYIGSLYFAMPRRGGGAAHWRSVSPDRPGRRSIRPQMPRFALHDDVSAQ
jgi:hypothetical protein